jgi:hypothetical protein
MYATTPFSTNSDQDPAGLEREALARLDADEQAMRARWAGVGNHMMSSGELHGQLLELQQWEQRLVAYQPTADSLRAQGRPQLGDRLEYSLRDLRGAIQIVARTEQNATQQEMLRWQIQQGANTYTTSIIQQVARTEAEAGQAAAIGWDRVIRGGYPTYGCGYPCPPWGW